MLWLLTRTALAATLASSPIPGSSLHALEQDRDQALPLTAAVQADGSVLGVVCGRVGAQVQCAGYRDGQQVARVVRVWHADQGQVGFELGQDQLFAALPHHHSSGRSLARAFGSGVTREQGIVLDGSLLPEQVDPAVFRDLR